MLRKSQVFPFFVLHMNPICLTSLFVFWTYRTRNDLWALGCTLYQMLSGTSPFKDASEWLIFQRIIARDIRFPNYFSNEARDLIDQLLVSYYFILNLHFHPVVPLFSSPIILPLFLLCLKFFMLPHLTELHL